MKIRNAIINLSARLSSTGARLAPRAEIGGAADEARDPGLLDGLTANQAGLAGAAVHRILRQEAPFETQDRAIAGIEARALRGDGPVKDGGNRRMQSV